MPDSHSSPDRPKPANPSLRKFLSRDLPLITLGGTIVASGQIEKALIGLGLSIFADPHQANDYLGRAARLLGNETENPNFRPVAEIVNEGITTYQNKNTARAHFQRATDYKDFDYYRRGLEKTTGSIGIIPKGPKELEEAVYDLLPTSARSAYMNADVAIGDFLSVDVNGSGFWSRTLKEAPKNFRGHTDADIKFRKERAKEYLSEAREFVEYEAKRNKGKPVSASKVFSFFIERNEGNISESLTDTYLFLKFAARNDFNTGDFTANENNISWMTTNILDEYGIHPYDRFKEDRINLIGKPYHTWNLIAMLNHLPSEIIQLGGIFRQLTHLQSQGGAKLQSDLVTLSDLKAVEETLVQFV